MTDSRIFQTSYDRAACKVGIVHVGYGAFHRAHQAVYLDDYMQATGDLRWGIAAVNLREAEQESFAQAAKGAGGYLLKSIAPDGTQEFRIVRSHQSYVDATLDLDAALAMVAHPDVHIVSMTVTESGYAFNDDWSLNLSAPGVAEDLKGGAPETIYGYLAQGLERRRAETGAPVTVMCCDNIRNNGKVLRGAMLSFLRAAGQDDLCDWVEANVSFPCSMVDRITPRSTEELHDEIKQLFPRFGDTPIHAEAFTQWVLENKFAGPAPDLAQADVQVVNEVAPYEEAKIRILNGGHTGLAYLGVLAGYQTFDQAMRDPKLRVHFDAFEREEVLKGLPDSIPFDTGAYLDKVAARFENAGIADQLARICMDGYSKMPIYIRPTLRGCLEKGITPKASYDCVASWVVYARKHKAGTTDVPYVEPFWDILEPLLTPGHEAELASDPQLWGNLPESFDQFVPDMVKAIQEMEEKWPD